MTPEQEARFEIAEFLREQEHVNLKDGSNRLILSKMIINRLKRMGFQITPYDPRQKP